MPFRSGIAPHLFQFIKLPCLSQHNMHHYIYIIDKHPLKVFHAFVSVWNFSTSLFHLLFYEIRNRSYLRLISSLTDYKIIRYSFRYFAQVKRNNVLSFFLLNCLDYSFNDF